jgi:hypothetical protein
MEPNFDFWEGKDIQICTNEFDPLGKGASSF